jgi:hypothetical protein
MNKSGTKLKEEMGIENHFSKTSHNISLWIDTYDDLFSDFDPRDFDERTISDDFLSELKIFSREKETAINGFTLLIPKGVRNIQNETVIVKRLNQYFKKNHHILEQKKKKGSVRAALLILIGTVLMIISSYISLIKSEDFFMHTLLVLTEPAGWFILWIGLETFFNSSAKLKSEIAFYNKLMKTKINFVEY